MSMDAYDPLYLERIRLMKLGAKARPMKRDEIETLRKLLYLVNSILIPTRSSASENKRKLEELQKTPPRVLILMHDRTSDIGRQMAAFQEEEDSKPEKMTWKILEDSPDIPLKSMAILSLVAFATMYRKIQLLSGEPSLATAIEWLKQPNLDETEPFIYWSETLKSVLRRALDVAARVMDMEEPRDRAVRNDSNRKLLASAVHKIVNVVIICWSQVVEVLSQRSGNVLSETLWRKASLLDSHVWTLECKDREFKSLLSESDDSKQVTKDSNEGATQDGVPKESPNYRCWRKLRQMLNPNNGKSYSLTNQDSSKQQGRGAGQQQGHVGGNPGFPGNAGGGNGANSGRETCQICQGPHLANHCPDRYSRTPSSQSVHIAQATGDQCAISPSVQSDCLADRRGFGKEEV